jgi:hypothetical protein
MKEYSKGDYMAQKWEYRFIKGERYPVNKREKGDNEKFSEYENRLTLSESHKILNDYSIDVLSGELGKEGWELVTVVTRSLAESAETVGMTTEELWVFKRPID